MLVEIGIIGGTGVYHIEGLEDEEELFFETPFGFPSSRIRIGKIDGVTVAFLARHDTTHRFLPSEIPSRANIYALKSLGVRYLLTFGSCGSLKEEVAPRDIVMVDQFIDRTNSGRPSTFFGQGVIAHVSLADPVCPLLHKLVKEVAEGAQMEGSKVHNSGTYVVMEGPAFSTRAESFMYRQLGATVIGMTAFPEAKLAREAEMSYALVALVTDYDCWREGHEAVTVDMVLKVLHDNGNTAQKIVKGVVAKLAKNPFDSPCHHALQNAILTPLSSLGPENKIRLHHIIHKYLTVPSSSH
jgi:5'-methylthioadenosine phosphorylase